MRTTPSQRPISTATRDIWLGRSEWIVAGALTCAITFLHVVNMQHAGGLWRDEAAAVHLALLPSLGEVWTHLEHESFPLLVTMLLRGWNALGFGSSDSGLRAFGFLMGASGLTAIWWNAWRFSAAPPLFSLLLFGLSPIGIRWGDSMRAYGLGTFLILLTLGAVWEVVRAPTRKTVTLALATSVLAVHALYQNAFLLAAILLAGAVVAGLRRDLRHAILVLSLGAPAAGSLLPYLAVIRRANDWNVVTQIPLDFNRIWTVLQRALADPAPLMFWLWAILFAVAIGLGLFLCAQRTMRDHDNANGETACFLVLVIAAVTGAYYIFLRTAQFPTEVWYYLVWMALMAVAIDALLTRSLCGTWVRLVKLVVVLTSACFMFSSVQSSLTARMTNVDLIARQLNQVASAGDLVIVHPWFCGATFARYYQGAAGWTTLPPMTDHGLQRLDQFKEQMQRAEPIQPVLEQAETTLRTGGKLWLVGYFPFANPPVPAPLLPRAGAGPEGWRSAPYMMAYGMELAYFNTAACDEQCAGGGAANTGGEFF